MSSSQKVGIDAPWILWRYWPSLTAAIIFAVIFFLLTCGHAFRLSKLRTLFFVPIIIGGLFETLGYCGRIWGHFNHISKGPYAMQSVLILVAPTFFAVSLYMTLRRIMLAVHGENHSLVPVNSLPWLFTAGEVFSFVLQSTGAGLLARGSASRLRLGKALVIAGLIIQIFNLLMFLVVARIFHTRFPKNSTVASSDTELPWKKLIRMLYLTSGLIIARNIFRTVEYALSQNSYLRFYEWPLYVFDAVPMAAVMALLLTWHPNKLQKKDNTELGNLNKKTPA